MSDELTYVVPASTAANGLQNTNVPDDLALMRDALRSMNQKLVSMTSLGAILSARAYQWATLVLSAGAWAYVLSEPTTPRIVGGVLFTGLTHIPTWIEGVRK